MRKGILFLLSVTLMGALGPAGCRGKPSGEDGIRSLREGLDDLLDLLKTGPSTMVVAGPKGEGAFLEDGSRWAAEELARVLRLEGFTDLVGPDEAAAVKPVGNVEVIAPGRLEEVIQLAGNRGARVIVFVGLRSIELRESQPRLLDWAYEGTVEILDPERNGGVTWEVTGSRRTQAANDVPEDRQAARRPLAEKWARRALWMGAFGLGGVRSRSD